MKGSRDLIAVRRVRYMPIKSLLPFIELLFALYFGYCVWNSIELQQWISVPFLMMFFGGFTYVAWKSVAFWLQQSGFALMARSNA